MEFWKRSSKQYKEVDFQKTLHCAVLLIFCLLLPWLAFLVQAEGEELRFEVRDIVERLYGRSNVWVRLTQIFLFVYPRPTPATSSTASAATSSTTCSSSATSADAPRRFSTWCWPSA